MSFLDNLSNLNPFRKKEDFGFPPLNEGNNNDFSPHNFEQGPNLDMGQPNLEQGPNFNPGNFSANPPNGQMPLDDHRMTMPLGDTIRQTKISAMYGNEDTPVREVRDHNPLQKDLELISSKLDYLKASLDAINQRLVNLEHMTKQEMENKRW
jgi:hypothetical protein